MTNDYISERVIAIIPAAGKATRLPSINCSKEILPIGYKNPSVNNTEMDKPVCFHLMEKLTKSDITKAIMVIREDKWDIPNTLGNGKCVNMEIAYQMLALPHGTAFTIDQAYPFVNDNIVAIGFPDILFSPDDAYSQILNSLTKSDTDIVLGLFPADKPEKVDMVKINHQNEVLDIVIKPKITDLEFTWGIAVWKPSFTRFLHQYLNTYHHKESDPELFIGDVIREAISQGLSVTAKQVSDSPFLDMGTDADLKKAISLFSK